eukprot:SAG31_NODE_4148_length_3529_cov_3.182216_2_plen_36_part_00
MHPARAAARARMQSLDMSLMPSRRALQLMMALIMH